MSGRDDILRYIDGVQGKLTAMDKKKVKALQEKAEEERKKRIKVTIKDTGNHLMNASLEFKSYRI